MSLVPERHFAKLGTGLAVMGAVLIGLAINSALQPSPFPYERTAATAAAGSLTDFGLNGDNLKNAALRRIEWRTPGIRGPVASALVVTDSERRVVALDWQNFVTEPILNADLSLKEVGKVLTAIREHVPENATLLSWWDLSRKIRFVSQRQAPLDDPMARGLTMPAAWWPSADRVIADEREFWGKGVPEVDGERFGRYIDTLLMDEAAGAEALKALAPAGETYIAVHLSDIWKVASDRPDRVAIAYRDFPAGGQAHGVIKAARQWMTDSKMSFPYAVEPIGNAVRLHYFTNKASAQTLLAKLLPFSESNPLLLKNFELVYQHRGFWIYKIKPRDQS